MCFWMILFVTGMPVGWFLTIARSGGIRHLSATDREGMCLPLLIPIRSSGHGRIHEPLLWPKNAMNLALRKLALSPNPTSRIIRIWHGSKGLCGGNWGIKINVPLIDGHRIAANQTEDSGITLTTFRSNPGRQGASIPILHCAGNGRLSLPKAPSRMTSSPSGQMRRQNRVHR